jgi:GDP-4-dehydro-6-deoxy-D-mannose reductase
LGLAVDIRLENLQNEGVFMRALITGVNGFAGSFLKENLLEHGYQVWGTTRNTCLDSDDPNYQQVHLNLSGDLLEIISIIENIKPDVIFHLSGQSSVKYSWDQVLDTFQANVMESIQLLEAVKHSSVKDNCLILTIGSSEEYGRVSKLPIEETTATNPTNPYGVSKLAMGHLAMQYAARYQLKLIHVRAFNHIGPRQALGFVTSDFGKQIAEIDLGLRAPVISVGDLSSSRDFTDVRDIVNGYRLLAEKGKHGEIYNICSGKSIAINDMLQMYLTLTEKHVRIIVDQAKFRPNEVKDYFGSNEKIKEHTGWHPTIPLIQSLQDIIKYWKSKLSV